MALSSVSAWSHQPIGCKYHPGAFLIDDCSAGDQICSTCGLVVSDRVIDVSAEWRVLADAASDPSRVGAAEDPLFNGANLHTRIAAPTGSTSADLDSAMLRAQRKHTTGQLEQKLMALREKADRLHLTRSMADRAATLLKQALEHKELKHRLAVNSDAGAAACLYIACKEEGAPRSFKEICSVSHCNLKQFGRIFKLVSTKINVKSNQTTIPDGQDAITRFSGYLSLPWKVQTFAIHIAKAVTDNNILTGRSPISVAAAAIHFAISMSKDTSISCTVKDVADVSGTTVATIKQCYKLMVPHMDDLLPDTI